jgi:hypothetical protein
MGLACVRGRTDHECHRDLRECPSGHRSRRTVLRLNRSNDDDVTWQCASACHLSSDICGTTAFLQPQMLSGRHPAYLCGLLECVDLST